MSTVRTAGESLRAGRYREALEFYTAASRQLGEEHFRWNIDFCRRKLDAQPSATDREAAVRLFNTAFDRIFVVNMREAGARLLATARELHALGIEWERIEAVDGRIGAVRVQYEQYARQPLGSLQRYPELAERERRRGSRFIGSPGAMGYLHTYIGLLQRAQREGLRRILILEDDVLLVRDFHLRFAAFVSAIGPNWKIIQLGASQYNWNSVDEASAIRAGFYHPHQLDTCGSFAMGVDASVYGELIEAQSAFESPFDHASMGEVYERHLGSCFVSYPNIVMPDVGTSLIRENRDQVAHSAKMRWRLAEFSYPRARPSLAVLLRSPQNLKYLDAFTRSEDAAVDLRLYIATVDGLRPVHQRELLDRPFNELRELPDPAVLPTADLAATLDRHSSLTEADIAAYVEGRLRGRPNVSALQPLDGEMAPAEPGLVSVVIPTYQRPGNLALALESVAQQDYARKEVIVVSDNPAGSAFTAETRAIVEACRVRFPGVPMRLVEHVHNRNGSAARNTGWLHSRGEYLAFLDDDDAYLPGRIATAVEGLRAAPATIGAVYCGFIGGNSPAEDAQRYRPGNLTREVLLLDYRKHYLHTNTATYRRSAVLALNGFDESYRRHQDLEFNLRFFQRYEMGVVRHIGVRLRPEASAVNNMLYNADIIALKNKFLGQFGYLIEGLDAATREAVYDKHWAEVLRYTTDRPALKKHLKSMDANGPLQISMRLETGTAKA